jgi:hypothetical protein
MNSSESDHDNDEWYHRWVAARISALSLFQMNLEQQEGINLFAYEANNGFDQNGNRTITVGELHDIIDRNTEDPQWNGS